MRYVDLSEDEEKLVLATLVRGVTTPLTTESGVPDRHPVWTPDGARVVFSRRGSLFWTPADGAPHAPLLP